jgi:signal transduction histidine kinase
LTAPQPVVSPGPDDVSLSLRTPLAAFRTLLVAICALLASLPSADHRALFPLAGLAVLSGVLFRINAKDRVQLPVAYAVMMLTGLAVAVTGGARSPMLPYFLAPGLALGLLAGPRSVLKGMALAAGALAAGLVVSPARDLEGFLVTTGEWVLLAAAVGLIASWAQSLATSAEESSTGYAEALGLLEKLHTLTRELPIGLDAGAAAESLLDLAGQLAPSARSGVLVQTVTDGALVPMAVRGVRRVPWRAPLNEPGPLRTAWETRKPVVDRRVPDIAGRRAGNTLAVVPLCRGTVPFGVVVLESPREDAFSDDEMRALVTAVRRAELRLETSLLFDEVRSVASAEERDRLAREMHNGVAQDLAFIGYRLDDLRAKAGLVDPVLAVELAELRKQITTLISDLRLSITDLRTSLGGDRGLGAALGSYIRAVGSGRQLTVHLSLQESTFRLPADREAALFRVAQIVAQDVRQCRQVTNLWTTLVVEPPSARLLVEHDGSAGPDSHDLTAVTALIEGLGGTVEIHPRPGGGARVLAMFVGGDRVHHRPLGR